MTSLNTKALVSVFALTAVMAVLLLLPAGTLRYWQAWVYLAVFFTASILITLYLIKNDPALLERRMRGGPTAESRQSQRVIMLFISIGFIGLLIVPALDKRFGWSEMPEVVAIAGDVLVAIGFFLIAIVYRENTFTSATIQVTKDQKVVSTGPYSIVRHPMYFGALLYLAGTPLALGSYWGFIAFLAIVPFLIWRIFDEERTLAQELPGYAEYQQHTPHRLIPGVW